MKYVKKIKRHKYIYIAALHCTPEATMSVLPQFKKRKLKKCGCVVEMSLYWRTNSMVALGVSHSRSRYDFTLFQL